MKIELLNVTKLYKSNNKSDNTIALSDVSLRISSNENVFVIGESGAGKTTLLNIIALIENYYNGNYVLNDKNIKELSEKETAMFRNSVFGLLFQDYALLEEDTVYENIEIPLIYSKKFKRRDRENRIREIAKEMQLTDKLQDKVKNLSGRQR